MSAGSLQPPTITSARGAGDPHLHTHVVISNKVQTVLDGKWRSLDSRPMHAATVAISEMHEAVFADHLTRALGVTWETRERGKDRNAARAIASVPEALTAEFSSRSRMIDEEKDRLISDYVAAHGHQPTARTIIRLRAQATLSTRPEKTLHSLSELTAGWRARASKILGTDATAWATGATQAEPPLLLRADDVPLDVVESIAARVVEVVSEKRTTWRRWNLAAEAARPGSGAVRVPLTGAGLSHRRTRPHRTPHPRLRRHLHLAGSRTLDGTRRPRRGDAHR